MLKFRRWRRKREKELIGLCWPHGRCGTYNYDGDVFGVLEAEKLNDWSCLRVMGMPWRIDCIRRQQGNSSIQQPEGDLAEGVGAGGSSGWNLDTFWRWSPQDSLLIGFEVGEKDRNQGRPHSLGVEQPEGWNCHLLMWRQRRRRY